MSHPTPTRSRRRTGLGAAAVAVVLATSLAACGSDDDTTTSTSASTPATTTAAAGGTTSTAAGGATGTTTQAGGSTAGGGASGGGASGPGVGKAPAANEGAIRAALKRSGAATKAAGTARYTTTQTVFGVKTSGTGTIDTATQTVLIKQRIEGGPAGGTIDVYGEKGKIYLRQGSGPWQVTDSPIAVGDPLSQVRLLDKAKITKIGGTKTYDGKTCREFTASLGFKDALESIGAAQAKDLLKSVAGNVSIPSTSCIDDAGLSYATSSSYDIKKILGDAVPSGLPSGESSQDIRISDYGTAPKPERPAGIDDAKPLGSGARSGGSPLTQ